MARIRQIAFHAGEVTSSLYAREELSFYKAALRTCRNFFTLQQGGVSNRSGTRYVREVKDSSSAIRLIPFTYSESQSYVLELGNLYMRLHTAGGTVLDNSPAWAASTPYVLGQTVNSDTPTVRVYRCITAGTSAALPATGPSGTGADITDGTVHWKYLYAFANHPLEVETPWTTAQIARLNFVQSGDVLTVVHSGVPPQEIRRYGHEDWRIAPWEVVRWTTAPVNSDWYDMTGFVASDATHPYKQWEWRYTAIRNGNPPEESLPSDRVLANKMVYLDRVQRWGFNPVAGADSYNIYRGQNGVFGFVGSVDSSHTTTAPDGEGATIWSAGTTYAAGRYVVYGPVGSRHSYRSLQTGNLNHQPDVSPTWWVLEVVPKIYFDDDVSIPSYIDTPPTGQDPFQGAGNYPSVVAYHEQRLVFGSTSNAPQTLWLSRTSNYKNFDASEPSQDDDSIQFTISSNKIDAIRQILSMRTLLTLTQGVEYRVSSGSEAPMTPSELDPKAQSYRGSSFLPPLAVGNIALYVQQKGNKIRELMYESEADAYGGSDLTVLSSHLFKGKQIVDWAYQDAPNSIVWCVLTDGTLAAMTYLREHEIVGWHRHDTGFEDAEGYFENVCVVPESDEDAVYFCVRRIINGSTVRFIERMASREITDLAADSYFVDCGLSYDGWNVNDVSTHGLWINDGVTFATHEIVRLSTYAGQLAGVAVGDGIWLEHDALDGNGPKVYRFIVEELIDSENVRARCPSDLPASLQVAVPFAPYAVAKRTFGGLSHLANNLDAPVSILADGLVHPPLIVEKFGPIANTFTLSYPAAIVHAGLAISAKITTLGLQSSDVDVRGRQKIPVSVGLEVEATAGLWVGQEGGELVEVKQRDRDSYDSEVRAQTDYYEVGIDSNWNRGARITVEQRDPLPAAILGLHPEFAIGG